ncbi:hypothetical protein [Brumimicrobium aurantiacum]|uniref:Uncharacterized protein n=1 Tax=Brumimicrobium aurantiacum TaxID=1737063 RepID=A0A3E1F235_9FLAO|nr:hypothetical protein [Brumimicrobium aurantiacum]RFC55809.1 hypothetical protein DXU93_02415 [Brumimicrobium aurantiacum]
MKEELKGPEVEGVSVAVVQELGDDNVIVYNVYIINEKEEELEQVLVTSKGYATLKKGTSQVGETEQKVETTTLRKLLGSIEAKSAKKVEPIMEDVLTLNNEYWVSFFVGTTMYDKKFIFLSETVKEENFVNIPILNKKGVLVG